MPQNLLSAENAFLYPRRRWALYSLLFLLALAVRLACFTGLIASDDLGYSYFAQSLAHGAFPAATSHLGFRLAIILPVALFYSVLGVGEWTTILLPLAASAASVPLLVAVGRKLVPAPAALLAGVLLLTFPVHVHYATILLPEAVMEFCALLGVFVFLDAWERSSPRSVLLAGVCFGLGYLAKEPAIFVGGALILYSLLRRRWTLALALAAGIVLILAAEHAWYLLRSGDVLYREHVIAFTQGRYNQRNPEPLAYRLFKAYPRAMFLPNSDFGLHSLAALLLAAAGLCLLEARKALLLALWSAVPFLYLNFGSTSLTHYAVIPSAPRYLGLIYPPLFLLAGFTLYHLLARLRSLTLLTLVLVSAVGIACAFTTRGQGYRAGAVARLREIGLQARSRHLTVAQFEGKETPYWACAMTILSGPQPSAGCTRDCLAVRPDAQGLPAAVPIPAPAPPAPADPCAQALYVPQD